MVNSEKSYKNIKKTHNTNNTNKITNMTKKNNIKKKNNLSKTNKNDSGPIPKESKLIRLIMILVFVFIIGLLLTVIFFNKYNVLKYQEIDLFVKVQEGGAAFNTSTDALNFAKIYPGGSAIKKIDIQSLKESRVHIVAEGEIAKFISVSENDFLMDVGDYKQVEIYLDVPVDTPEGQYSGKLKIYLYRK